MRDIRIVYPIGDGAFVETEPIVGIEYAGDGVYDCRVQCARRSHAGVGRVSINRLIQGNMSSHGREIMQANQTMDVLERVYTAFQNRSFGQRANAGINAWVRRYLG